MKLSMAINYSGGFKEAAQRVVELEKAGLDVVWIAEAYSFDAISQVGYLAAITERVEIATGILNVYSRTAALMAMTAAGCDYVSDGRFILGLGASGPQVIEGFHGVPYEKPMVRIKEYIESCRMIWKREQKFEFHGQTVNVPLPGGRRHRARQAAEDHQPPAALEHPHLVGEPHGPQRHRHRAARRRLAAHLLRPREVPRRVGRRAEGRPRQARPVARSARDLGRRHAGHRREAHRRCPQQDPRLRPPADAALYIGGMGARDKNFYNTICQKYGYVKEAIEIQDLYLDGKKDEAAAAVPTQMLENTNLVGPKSYIKERLAAYKEAGVTILSVNPVGGDPVQADRDAARDDRLTVRVTRRATRAERVRRSPSTAGDLRARTGGRWRGSVTASFTSTSPATAMSAMRDARLTVSP